MSHFYEVQKTGTSDFSKLILRDTVREEFKTHKTGNDKEIRDKLDPYQTFVFLYTVKTVQRNNLIYDSVLTGDMLFCQPNVTSIIKKRLYCRKHKDSPPAPTPKQSCLCPELIGKNTSFRLPFRNCFIDTSPL